MAFVLLAFSCLPLSCAAPNGPDAARPLPTDPVLVAQEKALRDAADQILLALATRDYRLLERWLDRAGPVANGAQAARLLLGPHAESVVFDRWDARRISISFDPDRLHAFAVLDVTYRRAPNRPPRPAPIKLHFTRRGLADPWYLQLQ